MSDRQSIAINAVNPAEARCIPFPAARLRAALEANDGSKILTSLESRLICICICITQIIYNTVCKKMASLVS
jgi:hypothetical protein